MATSPVIPKEKLSAYQRWELGSFEEAAAPVPPPVDAAANAERVKEIGARAKSEGFRAGHAEGLEAGRRDALAEAAPRIARLDALLSTLEADLQRLDRDLAREVVDLGLALARKLVGAALAARPDLIQSSVEEALRRVAQPDAPVQIVVNPGDAAIVRDYLDASPRTGAWSLKEDAGVARGGCRVETATGEIDATLEQRWERLTAALGEPLGWVA